MQELQIYRESIDEIDAQIITLISERFEVVKQVGEYKKLHNLPPLQPERWQQVLSSKKELAKKLGVNPDFIETIWNEIHKEALRLEE
ncbi:MAG: chorismate mutase [Candidatus Altimarinota bacterium]